MVVARTMAVVESIVAVVESIVAVERSCAWRTSLISLPVVAGESCPWLLSPFAGRPHLGFPICKNLANLKHIRPLQSHYD